MSFISCTDNNFTYIGRWPQITVAGQVVKAGIHGGPRIRFNFTGTSLTLNIVNNVVYAAPHIEYIVDGTTWIRTAVTGDVVAATGLTEGNHTCEIIVAGTRYTGARWVNASDSICFKGITVDTGATVTPWPTGALRKVLVIGDSIAEGESIIPYGTNAYPPQNDARRAWPYLVGEQLNYEVWVHAFGGQSTWDTFDTYIPHTQDGCLYKMAGIPQEDPVFDIVILEGVQNEYDQDPPGSANGTTSSAFRTAWQLLIDRVKVMQPTATIYCWTPIKWFPNGDTYGDNAKRTADIQFIATANNLSCIQTHTVEPVAADGTYWGGILDHPNAANSITLANFVASAIAMPESPADVIRRDFQLGQAVHLGVLGNSVGQGAHAVNTQAEWNLAMPDGQYSVNSSPTFLCWVNLLRNHLVSINPSSTVFNRSYSGWMLSDHINTGSVSILAAQTPAIQMVLIPLLINDWCYPGNPTPWATFQSRYRQLVQQVIDAGMVPVLVKETDLDPLNYNRSDGKYYPDFIAEVDVVAAEFGGLTVIDTYTPYHDIIVANGGEYKTSGVASSLDPSYSVHPNIAGHALVAQQHINYWSAGTNFNPTATVIFSGLSDPELGSGHSTVSSLISTANSASITGVGIQMGVAGVISISTSVASTLITGVGEQIIAASFISPITTETAIGEITGIGIISASINQIRAPNGNILVLLDIYGKPKTFKQLR